ncbi:MAG: methylenetetrahydrofolate reductase, partial [Planctomycetes bacterium]|nr:methylenetetrahydrofolate reductase [Planctomycetota bacterium]
MQDAANPSGGGTGRAPLRERMRSRTRFLYGVELVTTRGLIMQESARKVLAFAEAVADLPQVDWISVTDNAGGNPMLSPDHLGRFLRARGREVVIHLSCKDLNRNGLESRAWKLASEGMHNVLALTGDYPAEGFNGTARPVFDIDSVGLLELLRQMNEGLRIRARKRDTYTTLDRTDFFLGAVVSPFKRTEAELAGQFLKLEMKLRSGAHFIIVQLGFDARKYDEAAAYLRARDLTPPLIGNVYLLNRGVAGVFHRGMIPGCVVTDALKEEVDRRGASKDKGKAFFIEFLAKQCAILKGLGYHGAYIGGINDARDAEA